MEKEKKQMHTFIVLLILILLACVLTYVVPAGNFERWEDPQLERTVVVEGTYKTVENQPIKPWLIFNKFYQAICQPQTAGLMFFIMIIGGCFEIILAADAIKNLCFSLAERMRHRRFVVIPAFVCFFSIFGFTMGLTTASIIFVPVGIAVGKSLGFNQITSIAMVALGTNAGFTAGIFNPFSVGIAQSIAEVPIFSGQWLRWILLVALNLTTSLYIMNYGKKHVDKLPEEVIARRLEPKDKILLGEFAVIFILLVYGIGRYRWEQEQIVVVFMIGALVMGFSSKMRAGEICNTFTIGCKKMIKGVLVIGFAATIRFILTEGNILDTITYQLTKITGAVPGALQLTSIFIFIALFNFLVTSGSTKAALIMPILTPMADFLGLSRQAVVFTFQLGDGLTNLASPISTTLNGILAVSEESYSRWIRFYMPLVGINMVVGIAFTWIALAVGY